MWRANLRCSTGTAVTEADFNCYKYVFYLRNALRNTAKLENSQYEKESCVLLYVTLRSWDEQNNDLLPLCKPAMFSLL